MRIFNLLYISILMFIVFACKSEHINHHDKHPMVQIGNSFLYKEDLKSMLPLSVSKEDSIKITEKYVHQWIEEQLLYDLAKENLLHLDEINEKVDAYRRNLMISSYQEQLMNQRAEEVCSEDSLRRFYEANKNMFIVSTPLLKGLFIKIPNSSGVLAKVRRLYTNTSLDAIDKLEKYSLKNAVKYEYFYNKWLNLSLIKKWLPQSAGKDIVKTGNYEWKDDKYTYFLNISDYLKEGEVKPYNYVLPEIRVLAIEKNKRDFITRMKKEIVKTAEEKNSIKFY